MGRKKIRSQKSVNVTLFRKKRAIANVVKDRSCQWHHITQNCLWKREKVYRICRLWLWISSSQITIDKVTKSKLPKWIMFCDMKQVIHFQSSLTLFSFLPIKPNGLVISISATYLKENNIVSRIRPDAHLAFNGFY